MDADPAFPCTMPGPGHGKAGPSRIHFYGMSLRDYFAAHCPHTFVFTMGEIATYLGLPSPNERSLTESQVQVGKERLDALRRYQWADSMIHVRDAAGQPREDK